MFSISIGSITPLSMAVGAEPPSTRAILASAIAIGERRERVGAELTALLANEDADVDVRVAAAERLGWLEYRPAIPVLIRYIDLEPTEYTEAGMPVPAALSKYGFSAVPSLIQAYLEHHNDGSKKAEKTEFAFTMAIVPDQSNYFLWDATKAYLKGMPAKATDPASKGKIEHLLNFMSRYDNDD